MNHDFISNLRRMPPFGIAMVLFFGLAIISGIVSLVISVALESPIILLVFIGLVLIFLILYILGRYITTYNEEDDEDDEDFKRYY